MNDRGNYKGKTLLFIFYYDYQIYYIHDYQFINHISSNLFKFKFI